jgi:uncharacterized protein YyaL (SSP411 family)
MRDDRGAFHRYMAPPDWVPTAPGMLGDQVWAAAGLLDLYQATAEPHYLAATTAAMDYALSALAQPSGALADMPADPDAIGLLRHPETPFEDNAVAARALLRLASLTDAPRYAEAARAILAAIAPLAPRYGVVAGDFADAAAMALEQPEVLTILLSDPADLPAYRAAIAPAGRPYLAIRWLHPQCDAEAIATLGLTAEAAPVVYCRGTACHKASGPEEVRSLLATN